MNRVTYLILLLSLLALSGCERYLDRLACNDAIKEGDYGGWTIVDQGLAHDPDTGLRWYRCNAGERFTVGGCTGTALKVDLASARAYARDFAATSGRNWRLPTLREMAQLRQAQCHNPAINPQLFPSVTVDKYWASDESPYGRRLGCSFYTFNGNGTCRDLASEPKLFWLVFDG